MLGNVTQLLLARKGQDALLCYLHLSLVSPHSYRIKKKIALQIADLPTRSGGTRQTASNLGD